MIVDDLTVARAVLSRMIESDPAFEIAAVAGTAEDAIEALGECPRRHRPPRPRDAGRGRPQVDPANHRRRGGRQGHDRVVARRRGRRADRRRARARRRRHACPSPAPAGSTASSPKSCSASSRRSAMRRAPMPAPRRARRRRPQAALRAMPTDPIDVLAIGASTGGIHALGSPVPGAAEADRRADPRHPASAGCRSCRCSRASSARIAHRQARGRRGRHAARRRIASCSRPATRI